MKLPSAQDISMQIENFNYFLGTIVADPLDGFPHDAKIHIEQGLFVPNDPPGAYPIYDLSHYKGVVLSVHFRGDTWSTVEGSAVMIAPGIAATAAHVIEDVIPHIMERGLLPYCVGMTSSGLRIWRMKHITKVPNSDIMLLSLEYRSPIPADRTFHQARITARLPAIGELVMISGFRAAAHYVPSATFPYFPVEGGNVQYGIDLRIAVGAVTAHWLSGGPLVPSPCVEISCPAPSGMSGGPAFDQSGHVIGILSSSLNDSEQAGHSRISLLAPALALTVQPSFLNLFSAPFRLLDLDPNLCGIEERERMQAFEDATTGEIRVEMDW